MLSIRSKLVPGAAIGAAAVSGTAIAAAAPSGSASSSGQSVATTNESAPPAHDPSRGGHSVNGRTEKPLTGDTASKVRAAALAKVSGTVEQVETNVDSSAPYEAHIRKADGTEVEVRVSRDFTVAAVNDMGGMGVHP
jgi:uncharacterized membrane protein YkoI